MYYYKAILLIYDQKGKLLAKSELKQCRYANRILNSREILGNRSDFRLPGLFFCGKNNKKQLFVLHINMGGGIM